MNTKLKIYFKLFLFASIIICTSTIITADNSNKSDCTCCGDEFEGQGKCPACKLCPCGCAKCGGKKCKKDCDCSNTRHPFCGNCKKCCECCVCCETVDVGGENHLCDMCKKNCPCSFCHAPCYMNCACKKCYCCNAKIPPSSWSCASCINGCSPCGAACKTHHCKCENPKPSPPDETELGNNGGSELDPYLDIVIYDNDGNWIPFESHDPNYNEMNPGAFVMQTFEKNGIINEDKLNVIHFSFFPTSAGDNVTIERINDKIKLWKAEYNDDWEVINKRHEDVFGSSNSKTFDIDEFYDINDGIWGTLRVEGLEPGVSGLKSYINGDLSDEVKISVCGLDIDIDTDNNNIIDGSNDDEDQYEEYPPGKIIPINLEGDGRGKDILAPLFLSIFTMPNSSFIELKVVSGSDCVKIYENANKSGSINLPKIWASATDVPDTLYVDGIEKGQAIIKLSCSTLGNEVLSDKVALFVTDTISWTPAGKNCAIWAPLYGSVFYEDPVVNIRALLWQKYDIDTLFFLDDTSNEFGTPDDDCGSCTLENFKKMADGHIIVTLAHGYPGWFLANTFISRAKAVEWINGEENMIIVDNGGCFLVWVYKDWFIQNWRAKLDDNKAIAIFNTCFSTRGDENSIAYSSGGRVTFGYPDNAEALFSAPKNCSLLVGRMTGDVDNGTKRTTGMAYGNGNDYLDNMQMVSRHNNDCHKWTTLYPVPQIVFPNTPISNRKGTGGIIFDTYMDYLASQSANDSVQKSGSLSVSDRWWLLNDDGFYGILFNYDKKQGGSANMRAESEKCRSVTKDGKFKHPLGSPINYNCDKLWSF